MHAYLEKHAKVTENRRSIRKKRAEQKSESILEQCNVSCPVGPEIIFSTLIIILAPKPAQDPARYHMLYNNQINARTLIGQSAVGYCTGKPTETSRVF